jgi:spermidine synthase
MDTPPIKPGERWHFEYITPVLVQGERVDRVIIEGRSKYQHYLIHDTALFGRTLVLDDKTQSTALDEFVYHEAMVQPAMIAHESPRSVFIAGGGEGATAREVLAHRTVDRIVMVDIDREVVELCKIHLPDHHKGAFDDPRLEVVFEDAFAYLESRTEKFDIAIIDVPDPLEAGPAYLLFTAEFYRLLARRMNPGGIVVAQSGPTGAAFLEQCFSAVANTMSLVFPATYGSEAFVPAFGTTWGFMVASLGPDPTDMSANEIDARIAERVTADLRYYDGETHTGMFALPKYLRAAMTAETRVITRDTPLYVP